MKNISQNFGDVTPQLDRPNLLPNWVLDDFRSSGVPDALTQANIFHAEDVEALLELGLSHWARKSRTETTRAKAEAIASGVWFTYGTTLDGGEGPAIYAKPRKPRQAVGFGSQTKAVKYETKFGDRATPILPWVDEATAIKVFERQKIEPAPGETFWQTVQRSGCTIAITEGFKKALALMDQGIPAIALRGVSCWNVPRSRQLHEAIAQFAAPGREWAIAFDQDARPRTVRAVGAEIRKLGGALEATIGRVAVWTWDQSAGKGIDDALVHQGDPAAWLAGVISTAPTLDAWKRDRLKASLLAALEQRRVMPCLPERVTTGRYLPELPAIEPGAIYALDAPMGTGKTERIGADWVQGAIARGWNVLVLSPMNSLGQQTSERWDLPHIHNYDLNNSEQARLFQDEVKYAHGLVLCPDSLLRVPKEFWDGDRPLLVIFDEANQAAAHIVEGGTLGKRQSLILDRLAAILERPGRDGAIVLSEADLLPRTLNWISDLSKCNRVRFFQHQAEGDRWAVEVLNGSPSGYFSQLLAALDQGEKLMFVTSSQLAGRRLELLVSQQLPDKKVLRIDSQTNEGGRFAAFWRNPNQYLSEHGIADLLILSPSGKSGVSIEVPGFDAVWGYFTCLSPSTWLQQLGRYRLPVPRRVFAKPFIPTSGDEGLLWESEIQKRLNQTRQGLPRLLGLEVTDLIEAADAGEDVARLLEIQQACERFYAENAAAVGAEKAIALDYLKHRLQQRHEVAEVALSASKETSKAWSETLETIWRADSEEFAEIKIEDDQTTEWAREILDAPDSTRQLRQTALKVLCRDEFPGVDFNDKDECYTALFADFGAMRRGVSLQVRMQNLDWSKFEDSQTAKAQFEQAIALTHRLPKAHLKALLLQAVGLLTLLDGRPYSNSDPRAQEIRRRSLHYASEIRYYLGLNVAERQTPCEICNKLLRRLGLEAEATSYVTVQGNGKGRREWIYTLPQLFDATRIRLLRAATQRLTGAAVAILTEPPPEYTALMVAVEKRRRKPKEIPKIEPEILRGMGISVPGDGAGGVEIQGVAA
ncbi:plasmid replication protein, CyRepA1 family [Thermoleptolyngbya sp. M55_K2018_002]|uniref:plasmid replication protein, CyRepA1 family n=1 Tax=Thermoleptolyngbya sp. M55_K2018_002 TaxID=2747808 RepID=UPI001A0E2794|nr:plasmid replication protein, CyRepA1 family [Thermoleptolyngbya sp. M55_K2018_002]HIK38967.1 DUF3854 domain-containing protein [Thermoleptolyngbya sp. M55_K2018_002]